MMKKDQISQSRDIYVGCDPFPQTEDFIFGLDYNQNSTNTDGQHGEKKQLPILKEQIINDIELKSEQQYPLDSNQLTDRTINKQQKQFQFKNNVQQLNTDATEKNLLTNTNSLTFKSTSFHRNNNVILQNKDLLSHLSSFESLNDIGSKVRSVYNGIAITPVRGRAETQKNQSSDKEKRSQLLNNFSQQFQIQKDGIQIQLQQQAENLDKRHSQTPKVSQEISQGNYFQPSSRFFYESIKDIQNFSKQDKAQRFQSDSQNDKNNKEMGLLFSQDDSIKNSTKRSSNMQFQGIDRSKHNWGRPVTEQKKRVVSLDQPNNNNIFFENKRDEEAFYRKNNNLFNHNFLGKQLALNNKTCLKKLLKNNTISKDIKFDQKVFDKFQSYYKNNKLQNIVYQNTHQQTTSSPNSPIEKTNQLIGGIFQNQQSPQNVRQTSFSQYSQPYSEAFMSNHGVNTLNQNKQHNKHQTDLQISSQYQSNQNIDSKNGSKYEKEFQYILKDIQQENNSKINKWKYNMNIQSKRIQDVSTKNITNLRITSNQLINPFNNQLQYQNESSRKLSGSQFQSNGDVQMKITAQNIPSIGLLDQDLETSQTRHRNNSQPLFSVSKNDIALKNNYQRASSIKCKVSSFDKDQESSNSFGDTSRKFTKILEEENEDLINQVKDKPQKKYKKDIQNKPRAKSTFEQSLQKTISKQIGVDLKSCMPKKIKQTPAALSEGRKNFFFNQREIMMCFDELRNFFKINFLKDYSYKLILSETELSSEKFINRFLLFLSHCLNSESTTKSILQTPQSPNNFHQSSNFQQQLPSTPLNKNNTNNNFFDKTIQDKQQQTNRQKIGSKGGFRLSTSSHQALRNIFTDLKIPIQFQNFISDDVIELFKLTIPDNTTIPIFEEQLRNKMLSLLSPKQIIQELGGKLNAKRLFSQIFYHMQERYNINIEECCTNNIQPKQNSIHTTRYNSNSSLQKLEEDYIQIKSKDTTIKSREYNMLKDDLSQNKLDIYQSREFVVKQKDDSIKNKEEVVLEQIISLLSNEIKSFDNDKNIFNFDNYGFFFFKLSIQCVLERQGLCQKQIYKLLEKIEQNREYLCKQEIGYSIFDGFANKRQIALQLQEYSPITDNYSSIDLKSLSNSFIFLENILDFISNKIKTQAFTVIINKKFKHNYIQNGVLTNVFMFVKEYIFPQYIKLSEQQITNHPLLLQLKRNLEFIEHQSQYVPSQIWLSEQRQKQWNLIYLELQNTSRRNSGNQMMINDYDRMFKNRQSVSQSLNINTSQINSFYNKKAIDEYNSQNDDTQRNLQVNQKNFLSFQEDDCLQKNEGDVMQQINQLYSIKTTQNSHTCLSQNDNIAFLKYIFDFSFSFFDIYSAFDIEFAKKYYQINKILFEKWMNTIKHSLRQQNYTEEEISHQIFYFQKYSLLYQ